MRAYAILIVALLLASLGCTAATVTEATVTAAPTQPFNVLGPEDAPVVVIEFTDLQCPYCARFATQTFPQLRRNYIDTGRVRFASQDLPLPRHAFAVPAAVAARCAGEQGRFWEFREALFSAQAKLRDEPYAELAGKFDLDLDKFAACRSDERQTARVHEGIELARANGITSTPTFLIGRLVDDQFQGEKISGAQPYDVIAAKIDELLEAAR
jgi:protein-disulfide isomerase